MNLITRTLSRGRGGEGRDQMRTLGGVKVVRVEYMLATWIKLRTLTFFSGKN